MKKTLLIGATLLTTLTLTACSNSKSAKQDYIDNYAALMSQSKENNARDVTLKFDSFDLKGDENLKEISDILNNSSINIKTNIDYNNKIASFDTRTKISNQDVQFNLLFSKEGIYLENSQLKALSKQVQSINPEAALYGQFLEKLDQKYLLIDSNMMDMSIQGQNEEGWSEISEQFFKETKLSKDDVTKNLKDIPEKYFTSSGDEVTMKLSAKGKTALTDLKNELPDNEQSRLVIENLEGNIDIKSMAIESTLNKQTNEVMSKISGELKTKEGKTSANFKMSVSSKESKNNNTLNNPTTRDTLSIYKLLMSQNSLQEEGEYKQKIV